MANNRVAFDFCVRAHTNQFRDVHKTVFEDGFGDYAGSFRHQVKQRELLPQIGVVAETSCRYFRELGFPEPIETGVVVDRIGRSSIVWRIGLFQGDSDEAAAEGRFVHVYVDNTHGAGNRPVAPIPDVVRAAVEPLLRAPGQD